MDLRANTAVDVLIGPFVDKDDGNTTEEALTIEDEHVLLSKNGQGLAAKTDANDAVHDDLGYYNCPLDTTDTNTEGTLVLCVHFTATALPVRHEFNVMAEAAWDSLYAAKDDGFMDVNIKTVGRANTTETEADNLEAACAAYSVTRGLTGTALPAVAADGAGGLVISDAGGVDIDSLISTHVLVNTTIGADDRSKSTCRLAAGSDNDDMYIGMLVVIDSDGSDKEYVSRTITDYTGATKKVTWTPDTEEDVVEGQKVWIVPGDTKVNVTADAILADTDDIGVAGAGLTDLGGMSAGMKGEVESEANDALVALNLDHLCKTVTAAADMTTEVADNTIISRILANGDTSTFTQATDGLTAQAAVSTETRLAELDAVNLPTTTDTIATTTSDIAAFLVAGLGAPADAAADGDPGAGENVMQYIKQVLNVLVGSAGVVAFPAEAAPGNAVSLAEVIRAIHVDVTGLNGSAMRGTDSAALASVVGALNNAAAAGDPTDADTLMQYAKQLINVLVGSVGLPAFPAEQAPANDINLAEVIRAIHADVTGLNGSAMVGTNAAATAAVLGAAVGASISADIAAVKAETSTIAGDVANVDGIVPATAANVNTQVSDVLKTDTITEMAQGLPPKNPTIEEAIMYMYMCLRNNSQSTSALRSILNDAGTVIAKGVLADDGTTFTQGKLASGP